MKKEKLLARWRSESLRRVITYNSWSCKLVVQTTWCWYDDGLSMSLFSTSTLIVCVLCPSFSGSLSLPSTGYPVVYRSKEIDSHCWVHLWYSNALHFAVFCLQANSEKTRKGLEVDPKTQDSDSSDSHTVIASYSCPIKLPLSSMS